MVPFNLPEVTTITSEIVLSLYPILIKVVDTGLDSQILARLSTFATLSIIALNGFNISNILANPTLLLFLGLVNLVHIGTSYQAFKDLPAGPAMALFYTYPFLNIILTWFVLDEPINLKHLPWFILAFVGSILVIRSLKQEESFEEKAQGTPTTTNTNTVRGIFAAFSAALTESIIYVVTKNFHADSPFPMMTQLYGGALILFIGGLLSQGKPILSDTRKETWIPLLAFNILLGFIGYALRFWSIPRLSVTVFSILSFIGVFSAYAFGVRFVGEIPSFESLAGGTLIAASIAGVRGNFGF
jgi:drug/metabolite transporter (DMT)-like permease